MACSFLFSAAILQIFHCIYQDSYSFPFFSTIWDPHFHSQRVQNQLSVLDAGRLWVRSPAGSYQRLYNWSLLPPPPCLELSVGGWNWGDEGLDQPMVPGRSTAAVHRCLRGRWDIFRILWDVTVSWTLTEAHWWKLVKPSWQFDLTFLEVLRMYLEKLF